LLRVVPPSGATIAGVTVPPGVRQAFIPMNECG
jgi:hypothetical protein